MGPTKTLLRMPLSGHISLTREQKSFENIAITIKILTTNGIFLLLTRGIFVITKIIIPAFAVTGGVGWTGGNGGMDGRWGVGWGGGGVPGRGVVTGVS